jgi:hypothetical protein
MTKQSRLIKWDCFGLRPRNDVNKTCYWEELSKVNTERPRGNAILKNEKEIDPQQVRGVFHPSWISYDHLGLMSLRRTK